MINFSASVALLCVLSTLAAGQQTGIYVEFYTTGGGWQALDGFADRSMNEPGLTSGSNVFISNANSLSYRVYAVDDNNTNIGNVTISASSGSISPKLFIGKPLDGFISEFAEMPAGCKNLGSVSFGAGKPELHGQINGTLNGSISMYRIRRFDFGTDSSGGAGVISNNITHNPGAESGVAPCRGIYAKHVDTGSVILANRSDLSILRVYDDFEGSIQSVNSANVTTIDIFGDFDDGTVDLSGNLNTFRVGGDATGVVEIDGNVGDIDLQGHWGAMPSGGIPNYDPSDIVVAGDITGTIEVDGDFVGSLTADSILEFDVTGGVYSVLVGGAQGTANIDITNSLTRLSTGEPLLGSVSANLFDLTADDVADFISIDGDYNLGTMQLTSGLPDGSLISIDGSFGASAIIDLPADGLVGQVIVNAADSSGDLDGDVVVGSTTLATNYTTLSSEIGDGQVGVAPFNFHQRTSDPPAGEDRDCKPYHTEAVMVPFDEDTDKNDILKDVRIRHYGPVYADGSGPHFDIEFKSDVLPSVWEDRSGLFEIDPNATATSALTAHRDVVIRKTTLNTNGFTAAGQWRIRPREGKLRCGDVVGNPDADYSSWYIFGVFLEAPTGGLLLENGTTSFEMTEWGIAPYEVNADGETDSQDFADLADSYSSQ